VHLNYRAVPDRYLYFGRLALDARTWDELQIPVGLAFLFRNSAQGRTVAFYPGPAGATESELPLDAWDTIVAANPELTVLRADVEALLVRRPGGSDGPRGARGRAHDSGGSKDADDSAGAASSAALDDSAGSCHLVPIDACYELVGRLRTLWRGFDGGQEAHDAMDAFFAQVEQRSRPATAAGRP
jgi:hypothetical protein